MDPALVCTASPAARTNSQADETASMSQSARQMGAEISKKPSDTLSNTTGSVHQEDNTSFDCLKPSVGLSLDHKSKVCSCFASSEAVLPLFPQSPSDLTPPIYVSDLKESTLPFSPVQDCGPPQTSITSVRLKNMFDPEPFSSCSLTSDPSDRPSSRQSVGAEKNPASAPVSDLYIFEREKQDFILCPKVAQEKFEGPGCDLRVVTCACEHMAVHRCCQPRQGGVMLDRESDVSQSETLIAHAGDACEAERSVNDAQQSGAVVTRLTPQMRCCDDRVELWLDACQYLAGEASGDLLHEADHSGRPEGPLLTDNLDFPTADTPVSGSSPDGPEGIGCSDDDTVGRGPSVERWSSVDSWASALSDWTGIVTALPEDLTAAFTEIGAEIDALTQALSEVNAHLHRETPDEVKSEGPAGQPQPLMGVQDQPLKPQKLPDSSVLSGQGCLPLCLRDGGGSQSVRMLCDANTTTQGGKEREEIQSRRPELAPCPTHLSAPALSPSDPVASTGGDVTDVIPESLDPANVDLGGSFLTSNNEDPVILKIIEDTDLEKACRELLIEEPNTEEQFKGADVCRRSSSPLVWPAKEETQKKSTPVESDREGTRLHSCRAQTLTKSSVSAVHAPLAHRNSQASPNASPDLLVPARHWESQRERPQFITLLAPLGAGSPHVSLTSSGLRKSVNVNTDLGCGHDQRRAGLHTPDGIGVAPSLEGEALTHNKDNVTNPSPEVQLDLGTAQGLLTAEDIKALGRELSSLAAVPGDRFVISEEKRLAVFTLDIDDPFVSSALPGVPSVKPEKRGKADTMPHKTHRSTTESKARPKKDKPAGHQGGPQTSKTEESLSNYVSAQQEGPIGHQEKCSSKSALARCEDKEVKPVTENTEKASNRSHGKKKKKHAQHAQHAAGKSSAGEPPADVENEAKPKTTKGRVDLFEAKLSLRAGNTQKDGDRSCHAEKKSSKPEAKISKDQPSHHTGQKDHQSKGFTSPLNDEIKRRRLSGDKFGKMVSLLDPKPPKPAPLHQGKREESQVGCGAPQKSYSEVVKQRTAPQKEAKAVKSIQAEAVSGDPQSLCLWCQVPAACSRHTVTWSRDGTVLSEVERSAGDESRATLTISHASQKDLGRYQCRLSSLQGSVSLDYLLTYEVLSQIVIPPTPNTNLSAPPEVGEDEEEDVQCSRLLFNEDFLSSQYFGENQPVSMITEKVHFGEGMHRRAFRTKLHTGQVPLLLPGDSCVLKVHNSISHGTKNNEELIQRNFHLAVEECQVQSTAREYLKAYTAAAQSLEAFGEIPEIIPIYLVHRPSNEIPYATLEEELIGDFVKYSVKDGKEINLMRRDSEAGQKCCAFQHWVYHKTEGNLLVTDMQGVGMKLTDVGIATTKKGYKGFRGNCATSFIDQFKVLHQCNKFCEILGLRSLQPKAKKPVSTLKSKPPPPTAPKKKTFGPTVKGKS